MSTASPGSLCRACWEDFEPAFSPELECCQRCAEFRAWFEGAALLHGSPRTGKSGHRAGAVELINHTSCDEQEV